MIEASLQLRIPHNWMTEVPQRYPEARIKVVERKPYGKDGVHDLVEITAPEELLGMVIEDIKANPFVSSASISLTERSKAIGTVTTLKCVACRILVASDCFLIAAEPRKNESVEWTIVASEMEQLRNLINKLKEKRFEVKLLRVSKVEEKDSLTQRQEEIVAYALEKGYFDYPKGISIRELAKRFNISISTLSEILRKGQRKIMMEYFREKK